MSGSARNRMYASDTVMSNPESILFGGVKSDMGFYPQRLTYAMLHGLCLEAPSFEAPDAFENLATAARYVRDKYQHDIINLFLDNWYPGAEGTMLGGGPAGRQHRLELASKKPLRALARLKDKGLYAASFYELQSLMDDMFGSSLVVPYSVYLSLASGTPWKQTNFELSDDIWLSAIELTMIISNYDVYTDPENTNQWIRYLQDNLRLLWTLVCYIAVADFYVIFYQEHADMLSKIAIQGDSLDCLASENVKLAKELDALSGRLAARDEDKDALIAKLQKEIARLEHENADLHAQLDDFDDAQDVSGSDGQTEQVQSDDMTSEAPVLHALPDENVLFVGGHPNMLSKLKPLYPKWRFISAENSTKALPEDMQPVCIFMWSNHLNHALFDKVKTRYGRIPLHYLTATNLDRLQFEMITAYSQFLNNQE